MGKRRSMKAKAPRTSVTGAMASIGTSAKNAGHAMSTAPVLPYAGTSGHSGTDTSEARAREADSSGKTFDRQKEVKRMVRDAPNGVTVVELRNDTGWHHGIASSVLTNMHINGDLVRLAEKRGRCHVYTTPDRTNGRATEPYRPNKPKTPAMTHCPSCGHMLTEA